METKTCTKCGVEQDIEEFYLVRADKPWRSGSCRACRGKRAKVWNEESKEAIRNYKREWHVKNREKVISKVNDWVKANPEKRRKNALAYYYRLQDAAIRAYGGYKCNWCGIEEPLVLCLDHVENNGRAHRKELGTLGGHVFYKWLKDNGYPAGFQVLCMNCNHAKYRNGGVIPPSLKVRCNDHPSGE
jgi:hypothetical protein